MLYRDQGACWVDQDAPIDRYPMARGSLAAETNAHRFSQAGGTGWCCADPFPACQQRPLPGRDRVGAALSRRPGGRWIAIATALNTAESLGDSHR
jgi:hypothetical protein